MNKTLFFVLALVCLAAATEHVEENNAADELVRQINSMQSAIRTEQSNHETLWNSQKTDCDTEIAFRHQEVDDATNALHDSQTAQSNDESALAGAKLSKSKAEGYVNDIKTILNNLLTQRTTEHSHFVDVIQNQLNPAINAVNGVYPLLDELSASTKSSSFVQLRNHLNKSFIHMIKAQKGVEFTAILAQVLLRQSDVGISQDVLDRLTQLFDDLADDLSDSKNKVTQTEADAVEVYNTTVANYNTILTSLNSTIDGLVLYISDLNTAITTENSVQASASAKLNRNQTALDHSIDMCQAFQQEFDNATTARTTEVELLNKLKQFVRAQEEIFGDFGTDDVDALSEYQKSFAQTKAQNRANFLQLSLKEFKSRDATVVAPAAKCESCQKSFLQKKLGF